MMKYIQLLTFGVGEKKVTFTGREPFRVADEAFKQALLALGVFAEAEPGVLRYTGKVTVPGKNGAAFLVDEQGYLHAAPEDLLFPDQAGAFI